jgi:hypothetical protein
MELKYSSSGIPYIDMDRYGRLIFSRYTSDKVKGYKYLAYNHVFKVPINVRKMVINPKTGEKEKTIITVEKNVRESHVFNFKLKRDEKGIRGIPRDTIPPRLGRELRKVFDSLTEGRYFPYSSLDVLGGILADMDVEKICAPPKRKRKTVKKGKKIGKKGNRKTVRL